eukprot:UN27342
MLLLGLFLGVSLSTSKPFPNDGIYENVITKFQDPKDQFMLNKEAYQQILKPDSDYFDSINHWIYGNMIQLEYRGPRRMKMINSD